MKKYISVIIILLVVVLLLSCVMIFREISQSKEEKADFDALTQAVVQNEDSQIDKDAEVLRKRNLTPLFAENPDCIGWICIEGTEVDYPVMYTPTETQKYLHRNFEGEDSTGGVPFLQENTTLDGDHLIIYGHNMRNGSMFADVTNYADEAYCEAHPTIEFETAEGVRYYDVVAVALLDKNDAWYGFIMSETAAAFDSAVSAVTEKAVYQTEVVPTYGKQLLTLSTCYGSDDGRIVVISIER